MEFFSSLAYISILVALALVGLGVLLIVVFGARGMAYGKVEPLSIVLVVIPVALLVILGLVFQGTADSAAYAWSQAGIWTVIIMFVLGMIALLLSGVRGLFT